MLFCQHCPYFEATAKERHDCRCKLLRGTSLENRIFAWTARCPLGYFKRRKLVKRFWLQEEEDENARQHPFYFGRSS